MVSLFKVKISGEPGRPALVFVHGFMGSAADFDAVVGALGARYFCVQVSLPGHGGGAFSGVDATPDLMGEWGARLASEVLGALNRPMLVGYSMGGRLALQCALDHPDLLGSLLLVSTSPGIDDPAERRARRAQDDRRAAAILADFDAFLRDWYALPIFGKLSESEAFSQMLARRQTHVPEAMARVITALSPGLQRSNWPRIAALLQAPHPTRWLVGEDDVKYRRLGEKLAALGHDVRVSPGASHALHVERPAWLIAEIEALASANS